MYKALKVLAHLMLTLLVEYCHFLHFTYGEAKA